MRACQDALGDQVGEVLDWVDLDGKDVVGIHHPFLYHGDYIVRRGHEGTGVNVDEILAVGLEEEQAPFFVDPVRVMPRIWASWT